MSAWVVAYQGLVAPAYLASLDLETRGAGWRSRLALARIADLRLAAWWRADRTPRTFVALDPQGVLQGFASCGAARDADLASGPPAGELYALYVHPDAWGLGAGRALFEQTLRALRRAGARRVVIWALRHATQARGFYERQGALPDGTAEVRETPELTLDMVRYQLPLAARGPALPRARLAWIASARLSAGAASGALAGLWTQPPAPGWGALTCAVVLPGLFAETWQDRRAPAEARASALALGAGLAGAAALVGLGSGGADSCPASCWSLAALSLGLGSGAAAGALGPYLGGGLPRAGVGASSLLLGLGLSVLLGLTVAPNAPAWGALGVALGLAWTRLWPAASSGG